MYVDSRFASRDISECKQRYLRAFATEAASLMENARLVQAEAASRRYQRNFPLRPRFSSGSWRSPSRKFRSRI